jgi:DNA-binding transcriptional MerR regulator
MGFYTRGEVTRRTGLSAETIRYYERIGLVPPVARGPAGRRRYTEVDLKWLQLVHCLRDAGMPIAAIDNFTKLMRDEGAAPDERLAVLRSHEERIRAQIERLNDHLVQIQAKIQLYSTGEVWSPAQNASPRSRKAQPGVSKRTGWAPTNAAR